VGPFLSRPPAKNPCIVLKTIDSTPMADLDFNEICDEIVRVGAQVSEQPSFGKDGIELWVRCNTQEDVTRIATLEVIAGKEIAHELKQQKRPDAPIRCRIQGVDRSMSTQCIKKALKAHENLAEVTRITYIKQGVQTLTDKVVLVFTGDHFPATVRIGYKSHAVEVLRQVRQCFRCFAYDHIIASCPKTDSICGTCAETGHVKNDCKAATPKCANCGGRHPARATACSMRKRAETEQRQANAMRNPVPSATDDNISFPLVAPARIALPIMVPENQSRLYSEVLSGGRPVKKPPIKDKIQHMTKSSKNDKDETSKNRNTATKINVPETGHRNCVRLEDLDALVNSRVSAPENPPTGITIEEIQEMISVKVKEEVSRAITEALKPQLLLIKEIIAETVSKTITSQISKEFSLLTQTQAAHGHHSKHQPTMQTYSQSETFQQISDQAQAVPMAGNELQHIAQLQASGAGTSGPDQGMQTPNIPQQLTCSPLYQQNALTMSQHGFYPQQNLAGFGGYYIQQAPWTTHSMIPNNQHAVITPTTVSSTLQTGTL
jgi:hypothetical protein